MEIRDDKLNILVILIGGWVVIRAAHVRSRRSSGVAAFERRLDAARYRVRYLIKG